MENEFHDIPVHHEHHRMLPVWFFIGILLLIYGAIILVVGIVDYSRPTRVVLATLHVDLWAGILLLILGGIYTAKFWPRKRV